MTRPEPRSPELVAKPRWRELSALGLILLFALLVRGAWLGELRATPDLRHPPVDGSFTLYWARALATGNWRLPPEAAGRDPKIREEAYLRAPGYAYFLAATHELTGGEALALRKVQMAFGMAALVVAWWLGRRLFGPAFGLTWAGLLALSWVPVYFEGGVDETWFLVFGMLLLVLQLDRLLDRPHWIHAAGAGALVALLALFRANALLFVPVVVAWAAWAPRGIDRRQRAALATSVAAGALLLLAPALVRNFRVTGELVPISADAGLGLYRANSDAAEAFSGSRLGALGRLGSPWEIPDIVARLEADSGRSLSFVQASRELGRRARTWMVEHPGRVASLWARKLAVFFGPHEIAHNRAVAADRAMSPLLRRLPLGMPHALAGALVAGVLLFVRHRRAAPAANSAAPAGTWLRFRPDGASTILLMATLVAVWTISFLPFVVTSLYRAPVIPLLLAGLALVLVHVAELAWQRSARAALWGGALAGAVALAHVPLVPVSPAFDKWHFDRGFASLLDGRKEEAKSSFGKALEANPGLGSAHLGLGKILYDSGDAQSALAHFRAAVELDPSDSLAQFNVGLALARLGRWREAEEALVVALRWAPTHSEGWLTLGIARDARGNRTGARAAYEEVLARRPGDPAAANNLAWLLATSPEPELRDGARAVALAESFATGTEPSQLDTLAAAYAEAGRFPEAVAAAERALARIPTGANELSREIEMRLALYRESRPYRVPAPAR